MTNKNKDNLILTLCVLTVVIATTLFLTGCSEKIETDNRVCTLEYAPVCGVDGITYGNDCMAADNPIAYEGECKTTENENQIEDNAQIANPASVFCENNGGKVEIRTAEDGSQSGYCIINGVECEEWELFRGECSAKYTLTEVLNETCSIDDDCETPMNYLIRSNCPYTTKCLDEKCAVVCPVWNGETYPDVKQCANSCPQYSPPSPDFCKYGEIVPGEINECGCQSPPSCENIACTMDAKICSDGTAVGRVGPYCEFESCPNENIEIHTCTEQEKQAQICTMDYNPVCGSDGKTYGNGCGACAAKVDSWTRGECS